MNLVFDFGVRRFSKQVIIAVVYAVLLMLTSWIIFNTFYTPTCFDKMRNQGETKVDCGGPCPSCELKRLAAPLVANKVYFLDNSADTVDVGFQLKNPNPDWGAGNLDYQIDFIGNDGSVIPGSIYGSTFLLPNESKWVIEMAKEVFAPMKELRVQISTSSSIWKKLKPYVSETNFVVKDLSFKRLVPPQSGYAETIGTITNKSGFLVDAIELQGMAYDSAGTVIGLTKTTIFDLGVGQVREFRLFWPRSFSREMKTYKVLVNINLMDNETFLQKYGQ